MNAHIFLDINQLKDFLLCVAPTRPVFVWGPPGIGKSSVIEAFCTELGIECVALLGSQLAAEDLIGIPQIQGNVSRFVPPSMIVRDKGFCLFIDELNIASQEVQKPFYSLIMEKRIGEYRMPKDSIVIGAGNRGADSALVKQMPSALINRMIHIHLKVNHRVWLDWAHDNDIHPWVTAYIQARPSHLSTEIPPTDESPFSTPRSWHGVSDGLKAMQGTDSLLIEALVYGSLKKEHAASFLSFIKQIQYKFSVEKIIKGEEKWPSAPKDRDILLFLVHSMRDHLIKELPATDDHIKTDKKELVIQVKKALLELTHIDLEYAQNIMSTNEKGHTFPRWFLTEISKELPRLSVMTSPEKK